MAIISSLTPDRGRRGFVSVSIDGAHAGCIRAADVESLGLQTGSQVDEAACAHIQALAGREEALRVANRFIAFRPRSTSEVRQRLRRAGIDEADVESAVEDLLSRGVVDDKRFADAWIENRTAFSPRAPRLLQAELRRHGIDRETVEASLADSSEGDEIALAVEAGRRRLHRLGRLSRDEFGRTVGAFLARRGFSAECTRAAVQTLWAEYQADGEGSSL